MVIKTVDLMWNSLADAKLQADFAYNYVKEIKEDLRCDRIPILDGNLAYKLALQTHELAIPQYLRTLHDLKTALHMELGEIEDTETARAITPREQEVLKLIASGNSTKQIADQLGITFKTAASHRYHVQTKLNVHNTAELTKAALRMELIEL